MSPLLLHFYIGGVTHHCHGWEIDTLKVSVFYPLHPFLAVFQVDFVETGEQGG
jgi:hypothetical protein